MCGHIAPHNLSILVHKANGAIGRSATIENAGTHFRFGILTKKTDGKREKRPTSSLWYSRKSVLVRTNIDV